MFAGRTHSTVIELAPAEERLYRLPPMSNGDVFVRAFDAEVQIGPHGEVEPTPETAPTDLNLELRHSNHFSQSSPSFIHTQSLWHDDLWRLRVKRIPHPVTPSTKPHHYRIEVSYTSQLPVLERRIPASFFHDGFENNWNRQQYIFVDVSADKVFVQYKNDFRALYGLEDKVIPLDLPVEARNIHTSSIR